MKTYYMLCEECIEYQNGDVQVERKHIHCCLHEGKGTSEQLPNFKQPFIFRVEHHHISTIHMHTHCENQCEFRVVM